jgi:hypothetical protein
MQHLNVDSHRFLGSELKSVGIFGKNPRPNNSKWRRKTRWRILAVIFEKHPKINDKTFFLSPNGFVFRKDQTFIKIIMGTKYQNGGEMPYEVI